MTTVYVLCGVNCFLSVLCLAAVLFLSNSIFRILLRESQLPPPGPSRDSGLVDPKPVATYDPRFRS